jgi:hypothetical protein
VCLGECCGAVVIACVCLCVCRFGHQACKQGGAFAREGAVCPPPPFPLFFHMTRVHACMLREKEAAAAKAQQKAALAAKAAEAEQKKREKAQVPLDSTALLSYSRIHSVTRSHMQSCGLRMRCSHSWTARASQHTMLMAHLSASPCARRLRRTMPPTRSCVPSTTWPDHACLLPLVTGIEAVHSQTHRHTHAQQLALSSLFREHRFVLVLVLVVVLRIIIEILAIVLAETLPSLHVRP